MIFLAYFWYELQQATKFVAVHTVSSESIDKFEGK